MVPAKGSHEACSETRAEGSEASEGGQALDKAHHADSSKSTGQQNGEGFNSEHPHTSSDGTSQQNGEEGVETRQHHGTGPSGVSQGSGEGSDSTSQQNTVGAHQISQPNGMNPNDANLQHGEDRWCQSMGHDRACSPIIAANHKGPVRVTSCWRLIHSSDVM